MKQLLLAVVGFFGSIFASAQRNVTDEVHVFNQNALLTQCTPIGDTVYDALSNSPVEKIVQRNWQFRIVSRNTSGSIYVIRFFKWSTEVRELTLKSNNSFKNADYYESNGVPIYFLLTEDQYKMLAQVIPPRQTLSVGAATTIVKIRPGRKQPINGYPSYFDFANDFNLGLLFGYKYHPNFRREFTMHGLVGLSITSINLDSATTQGLLKESGNSAALTLSAGYVFDLANKFQLGIFIGQDMLAGEAGRKWVYRNRPWIGLSLGFSIFKAQVAPEEQQKNP